jgi:hypothetical protein
MASYSQRPPYFTAYSQHQYPIDSNIETCQTHGIVNRGQDLTWDHGVISGLEEVVESALELIYDPGSGRSVKGL